METISTTTVLDRGAQYLSSHPDDLVRRLVLAQILVDSRAVNSVQAGINAFKMWAVPQSKIHSVETILGIANDRAKT